ncbi:MAG: ester cyclase [Acidobacteriaceae bacterium]|nr:ester cyclase [Acidobacteriaceae bacterium]
MPIYTVAQYQVRSAGVEKVKRAIEEFVPYVQSHEPGTRVYMAWQQQDDLTRFVHFFIFQDRAAHEAHSKSEAVKRFEEAYRPELSGGDVIFTDYNLIASNQGEKGYPFSESAGPASKDNQEEHNKQVVREFTRIFKNEHNVEGVTYLFAKNFTHHFRAPLAPGLEGFRQIGRMMNTAFPDVVVTEEDLIAAGDKVIERSSALATHRGSLTGETPTNKRVRWTEIHIYRLENGRIREHWVEMAMMELLQQIGALPQPGEAA